ncbi:A/G-specific adenine glycosylase [Melghirimyces algeriensis]|uniref:Adenine DNA glycosylase n=1 Tax=Melghirimyces algeriensis TaxID=910412 RepID=A0A521DXM0_9BACL|nr:A/G-specific adenine glycosylase [Melghirimyces algeriensis]SMO76457.1 A/G-specific DNA-adenine glycosylase [Melghirimyces algeriensis]
MGRAAKPLLHPEKEWIEAIRETLLDWYDKNCRDLPWRKNKDPYRIWVSEIMLQQTRVDTVIPYYERFMSTFPTLESLAEADEEKVIKAWEGLGYYSRARNLHSAVKEVVEQYGGEVPQEPDSISRLKGVGPYTAGAILSIAFDRQVPAVDGNVLRVLSRLIASWEDISKNATRRKMEELDKMLIPEDRPGDFNQALMELGALVCTPLSPSCNTCPVRALCKARKQGVESELPIKAKGKPPVPAKVTFGWIRKGDFVLIHRRPTEGLLAGMWGLPTVDDKPSESAPGETIKEMMSRLGFQLELGAILGEMEHLFSHRRWYVTVVEALCSDYDQLSPENYHWVKESELSTYAFPNVYRKAIKLIHKNQRNPQGIQGRLF